MGARRAVGSGLPNIRAMSKSRFVVIWLDIFGLQLWETPEFPLSAK